MKNTFIEIQSEVGVTIGKVTKLSKSSKGSIIAYFIYMFGPRLTLDKAVLSTQGVKLTEEVPSF